MKTLLLLPIFLLLSTSFKSSDPDYPILVGRMEMWIEGDKKISITYNGLYQYCYMKYAIDQLFIECDTLYLVRYGFDTTFVGLKTIPYETDTTNIISKYKPNVKRI